MAVAVLPLQTNSSAVSPAQGGVRDAGVQKCQANILQPSPRFPPRSNPNYGFVRGRNLPSRLSGMMPAFASLWTRPLRGEKNSCFFYHTEKVHTTQHCCCSTVKCACCSVFLSLFHPFFSTIYWLSGACTYFKLLYPTRRKLCGFKINIVFDLWWNSSNV